MPVVTSTRTQHYQNGFVCRNLKTCSITKSLMSFVKQNYVWCALKANSASLLYFHINLTKIKSKIPSAFTGRSKIPYLTELRDRLLLFITRHFESERYFCVVAYCILFELRVVQLFKNRKEVCDNHRKSTQRKVTLQLSPQIWFILFYRGVKDRIFFFLKSANQNVHAWVKFDAQN